MAQPASDKPEKPKAKPGRPSLYDASFPAQAAELCLLGATDAELADHFGVATSTLYEWKNAYPEFSDAIKAAKKPADAEIASALRERAKGAEWVEEQAFKIKDVIYDNGKRVRETERLEVVQVTRRAPPDTPAAIFWLKNRRAADWKDKHEQAVTFPDLTREERGNRIAALLSAAKERAGANGNGHHNGNGNGTHG